MRKRMRRKEGEEKKKGRKEEEEKDCSVESLLQAPFYTYYSYEYYSPSHYVMS